MIRMAFLRQVNPSSYKFPRMARSTPITTASPYFSLYCSIVMFFPLSLEQSGFVKELFFGNPIKSLVGGRAVQSSTRFDERPQLDVIQERQLRLKGAELVAARVQAGLLAMHADQPQRNLQFRRIAPLSHETDTGDQPAISENQPIEVAL